MKPDHYVRPPKCGCKKHKGWRIDKYRIRTERTKDLCNCGGYGFIHAKGRGWCAYNEKRPPPATEAAHENVYAEPDADVPF
jgi:hypothetical protein